MNTIEIYIDSLQNLTNRCQFKQPQFDQMKLYVVKTALPCDLKSFAGYLNIFVYDNAQCPAWATTSIDDNCDASNYPEYMCDIVPIVRKTTYVTGDPHVYSYKKEYEVCELGSSTSSTLFQSPQMRIYGNDTRVTNAPLNVTQLNSLKIEFTIDSMVHTYYADQNMIDDYFDNGTDGAGSVLKDVNSNWVVYFLRTTLENVYNYYKEIYDHRTLTTISINRWETFYTVMVRAPHSYYESSSGILVNGCSSPPIINHPTSAIGHSRRPVRAFAAANRQRRNAIKPPVLMVNTTTAAAAAVVVAMNANCEMPCRNIRPLLRMSKAVDEFNATLRYKMCMYDCSATRGNVSLASMYRKSFDCAISLTNGDAKLAYTENTLAHCDLNVNSTCACEKGFTGKYCNLRIDVCLSRPCHNGGICANTTPGNFVKLQDLS